MLYAIIATVIQNADMLGDEVLETAVHVYKQAAETNEIPNYDTLVDTLNDSFEDDAELMNGDKKLAAKVFARIEMQAAIEAFEDEDVHAGMHTLLIAIIKRWHAMQEAIG